jgi:hypothetical protein
VPRIAGKGAGATDRMMGYRRDPDVIELPEPLPFTMSPPQMEGRELVTYCEQDGGADQPAAARLRVRGRHLVEALAILPAALREHLRVLHYRCPSEGTGAESNRIHLGWDTGSPRRLLLGRSQFPLWKGLPP